MRNMEYPHQVSPEAEKFADRNRKKNRQSKIPKTNGIIPGHFFCPGIGYLPLDIWTSEIERPRDAGTFRDEDDD